MDLVSLIVPIYNVDEYLEKCIQSLIKQTYCNLEIILVDDGSTDTSGKICDYYSSIDSRIYVIHKINGGLSDARNIGLAKAKGKYIMFVDGDDYLEPFAIKNLINIFEQYEDIDLICFEFNFVFEDKNLVIKSNTGISKTIFSFSEYPEILFKSVSASTKIYKHDLLKQVNFSFPLNRYCEDLYSIPCLYLNTKKIYYLNEALYNYIQRSGSIIRSGKTKKLNEDRKAAMENICHQFYKMNLNKKYNKELEFLKYYHIVYFPIIEIIKGKGKDEFIYKIIENNRDLIKKIKLNKYFKNMKASEKIISYLISFEYINLIKLLYKIKNY